MYESYTKCETDKITETFKDTEDSVEGQSLKPEGGSSEDPDVSARELHLSIKKQFRGPRIGTSEGIGKGIPQDLKAEANYEDSGPEVLERI